MSRSYASVGDKKLKMNFLCSVVLVLLVFNCVICELNLENCCNGTKQLTSWEGSWTIFPTATTWSLRTRIPMLADFSDSSRQARGKYKIKKKYKKYFLPLLLAYKLKFFTLIPVLIGGLVLLTGATGLAGFFFALFAAVMGLKSGHQRSKWRSLI